MKILLIFMAVVTCTIAFRINIDNNNLSLWQRFRVDYSECYNNLPTHNLSSPAAAIQCVIQKMIIATILNYLMESDAIYKKKTMDNHEELVSNFTNVDSHEKLVSNFTNITQA